jgi:E3 ubiquitin-protein ligase UBR7
VRRRYFHFAVGLRLTHVRVVCWALGLSLEELGLRALGQIPRDRAIDGIQAFMDLRFVSIVARILCAPNSVPSPNRDGLKQYLKPFAEQGKEVNESDIQAFFEARKQEKS